MAALCPTEAVARRLHAERGGFVFLQQACRTRRTRTPTLRASSTPRPLCAEQPRLRTIAALPYALTMPPKCSHARANSPEPTPVGVVP